jgi:hypothetical protein
MQVGPRRVDRRCIAGRSRTNDENLAVVALGHSDILEFHTSYTLFLESRREGMCA